MVTDDLSTDAKYGFDGGRRCRISWFFKHSGIGDVDWIVAVKVLSEARVRIRDFSDEGCFGFFLLLDFS